MPRDEAKGGRELVVIPGIPCGHGCSINVDEELLVCPGTRLRMARRRWRSGDGHAWRCPCRPSMLWRSANRASVKTSRPPSPLTSLSTPNVRLNFPLLSLDVPVHALCQRAFNEFSPHTAIHRCKVCVCSETIAIDYRVSHLLLHSACVRSHHVPPVCDHFLSRLCQLSHAM